jgi:hypothetical protein
MKQIKIVFSPLYKLSSRGHVFKFSSFLNNFTLRKKATIYTSHIRTLLLQDYVFVRMPDVT